MSLHIVLFLYLIGISGLVGCTMDAKISQLGQSTLSSLAACSTDSVLTEDCKASANQVVTETFGSNVTSWSNGSASTTITGTIADGYYSGKTCSFAEANLLPTNIRSGTSVFGVTGSLVAAYAACVDDNLNASACSTANNRYIYTTQYGGRAANCSAGLNAAACWTNAINQYVTSTAGANVSGGNGSLSATIPLGYYDGTQTATMSDTNLAAGNIRSGVNIFGTTGTYTGTFAANMASTQARNRTQAQVSLYTESTTNSGTSYTNSSTGYRAVPSITKDDDGSSGGNVTFVNRTGWDTTCDAGTGASGGSANSACKCGLSGTIAQRIADCAAHGVIGAEATWNGSTKGNSGEGQWKLVTRTASVSGQKGREVWQDARTGLLWSSLVSTSLNWCKASGSNNVTNNPTAQADPSNYCNNVTYQVTGTWSAGSNKAVSACFEDIDDNSASDYFTTTDANIDNQGKGGLGIASTPLVAWRLPTANDYKLADVDGLRFVMPDTLVTSAIEWTATIESDYRPAALTYYADLGDMSVDSRTISYRVRCVGR